MSDDEQANHCRFPERSNDPAVVEKMLSCRTVAVVGLSHKEERDSYRVARYLKDRGYRIVPVNPARDEIMGERCYRSLADIPFAVELVNVFRKPSALPALAEDILAMTPRPGAAWFQIGVVNDTVARTLSAEGLEVVQNLCMMVEHRKRFP